MMFAITRTGAGAPAMDVAESWGGAPVLALAVDTLKQALLLFDATGHVLSANASARRAIEARPEIQITHSPEPPHEKIRLQLRRSAQQLKLERALRACAAQRAHSLSLQAAVSREIRPAQALILTYEQGQPGLILQISPLPPHPPRTDGRAEAAMLGVLIDRSNTPSLDPTMLRDLFGLTAAESRVAEAYLRADTVKDVAALLGVSANTVKTHLAAAYLKTGCTRQAQLVRLLMSLSDLTDETPRAEGH